jgi:hypothetical protein
MNGKNLIYLGILISALAAPASNAFADAMPELVRISQRLANPGNPEEWPDHNDPEIFDKRYIYNYAKLMSQREARLNDIKMPWSDTWWPSQRGGIANRWQEGEAFPYFWPGTYKEEMRRVMSLSPEEMRLLSPAEKYDIAVGDYTFSMTREVIGSTTPSAPIWWGICEGWTGAALNHPEPDAVTIINPDGIRVEFGSSDVKGLMALFYAWEGLKKSTQLGFRCGGGPGEEGTGGGGGTEGGDGSSVWWQRMNYGDCYDVHPAAFHIVLLNQIGFLNEGFAADVDGGVYGEVQGEIWNQPIFAYKTKVLEEMDCRNGCDYTAPDTVKQYRVETLLTFADDDRPIWKPTHGTPDFFQETRAYEYWLEVDKNGNIVGGSWVSAARPDFLWVVPKSEFTGAFAGLKQIYKSATQKPYCVPQRYIDQSAEDPSIPLFPVGPVCKETP